MSRGDQKNLSSNSARNKRNKTSRTATHTKHVVMLLFLLSGLIGITSRVTEEIQPTKATAVGSTHASDKTLAKLPSQANQALQTLPEASQASQATTPSPATTQIRSTEEACDNQAKAEKIAGYQHQITEENSRHTKIINQLNNTGLVTRYLNANMYVMRINNEEELHETTQTNLAADLDDALTALHCER